MNNINQNTILIILGFGAIIIEVLLGAATGFDLLLIGLIFIISGVIGNLTGIFSLALVSIAILSFLYIFIGRTFVKQKLSIKTTAMGVNALMGKTGTVVKKITTNNPGQIKVEGEVWRAESSKSIDEGREVVVQSVSGVTLKVHPKGGRPLGEK